MRRTAWSISFHPAAVDILAAASPAELVLLDVITGEILLSETTLHPVTSLAFHPDGSMLVYVSNGRVMSRGLSFASGTLKVHDETPQLSDHIMGDDLASTSLRLVQCHPHGAGYVVAYRRVDDVMPSRVYRIRITTGTGNCSSDFLGQALASVGDISHCGTRFVHVSTEGDAITLRSLEAYNLGAILRLVTCAPNAALCRFSPAGTHVLVTAPTAGVHHFAMVQKTQSVYFLRLDQGESGHARTEGLTRPPFLPLNGGHAAQSSPACHSTQGYPSCSIGTSDVNALLIDPCVGGTCVVAAVNGCFSLPFGPGAPMSGEAEVDLPFAEQAFVPSQSLLSRLRRTVASEVI